MNHRNCWTAETYILAIPHDVQGLEKRTVSAKKVNTLKVILWEGGGGPLIREYILKI